MFCTDGLHAGHPSKTRIRAAPRHPNLLTSGAWQDALCALGDAQRVRCIFAGLRSLNALSGAHRSSYKEFSHDWATFTVTSPSIWITGKRSAQAEGAA